MTNPAKRHGFTLIEILCVIALLGVLGMVMAVLLREIILVERTQAQGFDRLLQSQTLADQFRADVAQAQSAPPAWQQFKADAHTLILQRKNGDHIVYRWQAGQLQRLTVEARETTERTLPLDGKQIGVEFVNNGNVLRLRLLTLHEGKAAPGQTLEIAAALEGDWR